MLLQWGVSVVTISQALLEIPTGVISDKFGRVKTIKIASLLYLLSGILFAFAYMFANKYLLLIGGLSLGAGRSFKSGTIDALIYETLQELDMLSEYSNLYSKCRACSQFGLAVGALLAAFVVYFWPLYLLAYFSISTMIVQVLLAFLMVEPKVRSKSNKASLRHFLDALSLLVKNTKLFLFAITKMLNEAVGINFHRLEVVYFATIIPIWLTNIARVFKHLCGTIGFLLAKFFEKTKFVKVVVGSVFLSLMSNVVGFLLNNTASPFIISCTNLFGGVKETLESKFLQANFSKEQRATMGSIVGLIGGIFSGLLYYCCGLIADLYSVLIALYFLVSLKVVVLFLYYFILRKD